MSAVISIDCKDLQDVIPKSAKDIVHNLFGRSGDSICQLIAQKTTDKIPGLDKTWGEVGFTQEELNYIPPLCAKIIGACKGTFCSKGEGRITATCADVKKAVTMLLLNKTLIANLVNDSSITITDQKSLCDTLQTETKGVDPKQLGVILFQALLKAGRVKNPNPDLVNKYGNELGDVLLCICPDLGKGGAKPGPPPGPKPSKKAHRGWQKSTVTALGVTVGVICAIVLIIFLVLNRNAGLLRELLVAGIVLAVGLLVFVVVLAINPDNLFFNKVTKSEGWKPVTGEFVGKTKMLGVAITVDAKIDSDNTLTFNTLSCDGGSCPRNNLLEGCSSKKVMIDVKNEVDAGAPLVGECISVIQKIQNSKNASAIPNVWIGQKKDGSLFLNVEIDVYIDDAHISLPVTVPMNKKT